MLFPYRGFEEYRHAGYNSSYKLLTVLATVTSITLSTATYRAEPIGCTYTASSSIQTWVGVTGNCWRNTIRVSYQIKCKLLVSTRFVLPSRNV